jgi:hypothetical protein
MAMASRHSPRCASDSFLAANLGRSAGCHPRLQASRNARVSQPDRHQAISRRAAGTDATSASIPSPASAAG